MVNKGTENFNRIALKNSTILVNGNPKEKTILVAKATLAEAFIRGTPNDIASIMISIASLEDEVEDKADMYIEALKIGRSEASLLIAVIQVITQEGEKLDDEDRETLYEFISDEIEEFDAILKIAENAEEKFYQKEEPKKPDYSASERMYHKWYYVITSEEINKFLYNDITSTLAIIYESGEERIYTDVQKGVFDQLMKSASKGEYIKKFIEPNFEYRRVK